MANTVKLKRSSVASKAPATTDLDLGELAINTYDGKLYLKKSVSGVETVVEVGKLSFTPVNVAGDTMTGRLTLLSVAETRVAPSISSGTLTLNCASGNVFEVTLNANVTTLSFSNVPSSGTPFSLTLSLVADGTGRSVTWGGAVKWPAGTAPTLTSTNGKIDVFVLFTDDGGTSWLAFVAGQNL